MMIQSIQAGVYAVNCYILACEDTKKACIIDPGGEPDEILNFIHKKQLDVQFIILTHGHGDHIGGIPKLKEALKVPVCIHEDDYDLLKDKYKNLSVHMSGPDVEILADRSLKDQETLAVGNLNLKIIHTPGHTRGGICILVGDVLFTGDTLFAGSVGRTDFEGGSYDALIRSIKSKLLIMDDQTKVLPGHGPVSTMGQERRSNPFVK